MLELREPSSRQQVYKCVCVDERGTEGMADWIIPCKSCENFGFTLRDVESN